MNKKENARKCSICGGLFWGYGNDPYPINNGRCCDKCNYTHVIPARIKKYLEERTLSEH